MLVEGLVLVIADVGAGPGPQGGRLVDGLVLHRGVLGGFLSPLRRRRRGFGHHHRHGNMVGILLDDTAYPPVIGKLFAVLLQVEGDAGTALLPGPGLYGELGLPVGFPQHALVSGFAGLAGVHFHPLGNDKRRIETDPELADELGILFLVPGQAFQESRGARFGDGSEVFDHLVTIHTYAVITDGDGVVLLVPGEVHGNPIVPLPLQQAVIGQGLETQLVDGITGVGDQLAQENLLVGVQGVNHQMKKLLGLGLETQGFLAYVCCHGILSSVQGCSQVTLLDGPDMGTPPAFFKSRSGK